MRQHLLWLLAVLVVSVGFGCSHGKPASSQAPVPLQRQEQQQQQQVVIELRVLPEDAPAPSEPPAPATSQPGESVHLIAVVKPPQDFSVSSSDGRWTYTATGRIAFANPATPTYRVMLNYRATSATEGSKGLQTTWELKPGESVPVAGMLGGTSEQQVVVKLMTVK